MGGYEGKELTSSPQVHKPARASMATNVSLDPIATIATIIATVAIETIVIIKARL